ncbi:MAG: hypothetical protein KGI75_19980 [Rhizobiaceae bacterium]|nr:hypothetical protein [Rhizobiaceae bacterium]
MRAIVEQKRTFEVFREGQEPYREFTIGVRLFGLCDSVGKLVDISVGAHEFTTLQLGQTFELK